MFKMVEYTTDQEIDQSYRFLDVAYPKEDLLEDLNWHLTNSYAGTYTLCPAQSFVPWKENVKSEFFFDLYRKIESVWPHVDERSTGYYYYKDEGIGLQPHTDKHGDHPGKYYTLLFPLEGLGILRFYKEKEHLLKTSYVDPFYNIYDDNPVQEIGSVLIDKPMIFNPTEIVHALDIVERERKILMIRYHSAPDIDQFKIIFEERWNETFNGNV